MENASKALIIAGSILLAIMIVALGVTIFNRARNSADTSSLDSTEVAMFNKKFENYAGTQLGSNVKALLSACISNAGTNKDEPMKLVEVILQKDPDDSKNKTAKPSDTTYITDLGTIRNNITSTHPYTVTTTNYLDNGLVSQITIEY